MKLNITTIIQVNDKDPRRCDIKCQHVEKIQGIYNCTLFEQEVDTGEIEDDDIGYGFTRVKACVDGAFSNDQPQTA